MISKKNLVLGFAAAVLAVPSAYAQVRSPHWYVGGGLGQSKISLDSADFDIPPATTTKDEKDTAWKVFAGYNFTPNFGAELLYANMGSASATLSAGAGGSAKLDYEATSFALAGTGRFPIGTGFSILGRLGVAQNSATLTLSSASGTVGAVLTALGFSAGASSDKTKTDLYWGLGAQYDFNQSVGVRLDYDNFGKFGNEDDTGRAKVDMLSVNVVVRF